jgi:hypothetical protein
MSHGQTLLKITVNDYQYSRRMRGNQSLDIVPLNRWPNFCAPFRGRKQLSAAAEARSGKHVAFTICL